MCPHRHDGRNSIAERPPCSVQSGVEQTLKGERETAGLVRAFEVAPGPLASERLGMRLTPEKEESARYAMKQNRFFSDRVGRSAFQVVLVAVVWGSAAELAAQSEARSSAGPASPQLIEDLVAAYRALAQHGVLDGYGHVSARHDRDPNRYLMSRSLAPELVAASDIMEFDLDSNPVDARGRTPVGERFIHGEVYKARPDVKVVVHHHAPSVIPFGVSQVPLRPIYHMASFLWEGVPVFEIRSVEGMTDMLVGNPRRGRALAQVLEGNPALLMRGHGAVVVGPNVAQAVGRSIYMELNARLQAQAMALGGKITYLEPEEGRKAVLDEYRRGWEMWRRKALEK